MNDKQITKRFMALFLSLIMLIGIFPLDIFAETFTTTDTSGKSVVNTTDWQLKEENLKGKNYWPLAAKQYLREVSTTAEPMKNPMIGYGGYFIRPDGRTVIRLTMRKFDKVGTGVWHVMQMKLEDSFNEKVDWNDTQTGIYQGVSAGSNQGWYNDDLAYKKITQFATPSITDAGSINVKEVNIADNGNTGATAALNEVPINLVLKDGQSVDSFTKEPLVQIRMLARDKLQVACYTDAGSGLGNYSTYTFSSIVPIKHNYEQNLLREIRASVTPDRAFRAAGSSVLYNKEKGYIEVRHRYNKVAITNNQLYGRKLGYRQTVNKKFFDVLNPKDASGTIAHIFSTSNNGLPTAAGTNRLDANGEPTSTGSVPVLKDNINFLPGSDLGFIQVAATDFNRDAEAQEGIKTNFTTNQPLDSWLDGAESLLNNGQGTTVRYYVDTDKVDKLLGGDDGLQYFPFYSAIIMDNKDGQYKYTFKLTKDVTLNAGDKIKIDFKTAYGAGLIGNSAKSRNREMRLGIRGMGTEMFLGSNFLNVDKGLAYEYTVQNGMAMKLKAGTELYLYGNYPDGGEATLHFKNETTFYKANYVVDKNPIVLDWQGTYLAGTVTTTFQKPDVDEIFLGDKKITGRTAYEAAEVNIRKSKADEEVQTIIAKPGNTSNKDDSRIDVVVNNVKEKGYEFDSAKPGNEKDGKTPRTFTMPELKRDMPLLFTNVNVETLAEESRPAVVEQVQAKVNFDLNGVKSKDNKDAIEKIAPLSKDYAVDIETGAANDNYKASGFEGENVKVDENNKTVTVTETIDGKDVQRTYQNVINHDGKVYDINNQDEAIAAKEKQALKLRQMPDKYDINVPQGKKLLGWTTIKLEDKVENGTKVTVAEQFNDLKDKNNIIKDIADWQTVDAQGNKQNYIFDAKSPIDKNRTVYAVYGEGINLILHSNNTTDPKDETIITVPLVISDVDKTNKILDAVSSATLSNMKDNLIIKELPKVPVTGEQADMDKIIDTKAKLFNIPKNSFIGWTTKRYTNDNTSGFAAGNNNERIGEITTGLVAKGTKRIPQKTEWLQDLNKLQNTYYIPNGYSVAVRPSDIDEDFTEIKKAIDEGKDIHLYANYRPFFDVNVVASYKNIDPTVDPTHKYGKYVDTVDAAKKQATNIGLLKRTAVTNYGTPTVHQNANYYPLGDEGIQAWDGTEKTLTWKVPGFDELGQRLSYVSVVVPDNKVQAYKDFAVPNWGSLGLKTYLRINNNDGTTTLEPTAPHNLHDNAGNPYGDNLAKDQAYSLGVDAYTSATSRKAVTVNRQGTKEVTGYTIWNTSTPIDIPKPVFDNVWDTDTVVNLNWGDAERKADIKKIKLKVADGDEVVLEKQQDGTYKKADGTIKTTIFQNKLRIATLNLTGKEGKNIVAKYVVEKSGKEIEGPQGDIQINKKGTSAPVDRMKQIPNNDEDKPVVEFDIPNPTLNKPTPGTEYVAQKWDKDNNKWVDAGKTKMENTDTLGQTKTITLDGVTNDDIIRIVSKQPDMIPAASNTDGDNAIGTNDVAGRNFVKIDAVGPEINPAKAEDEEFRRFIDLTAVLGEIPEGRKVTIEVEYTPVDKKTFTSEIKTTEDKKNLLRELNTILRKGTDENNINPTIKIIAVDEFGNKTEKIVTYKQTYQLEVQIKQYAAGKSWVKVTADKDNSTVTLRVIKASGGDLTETKQVETAGVFVKVRFTNYKLKPGDKIEVKGTCQEAGKTYTANPMILDI